MSRSGYHDDGGGWSLICWRGAVAAAMRGKRGQAFLKEMLAAFDAMPEKRLVAGRLVFDGMPEVPWNPYPHEDIIVGADVLVTGCGEPVHVGEVCALGAVGLARNLDMSGLHPDDPGPVADAFGIAAAMSREIVYMNDEHWDVETPEQRFTRMRAWVAENIHSKPDGSSS
jgi:hypothetical protein